MEIPQTIKIGGHLITVKEVEDLDNEDNMGRWIIDKNEIQIEKNMPQSQKETTLIHEILEAIVGMNDLKLEHRIISLLETSLYQVLKDNNLLK